MASLALSAATFDNEEPKSGGILQKRRNRTHKNTNNMTDKSYYSNKVNDVLSKIHNQIYSDNLEEMEDTYENFEPITRPTSMKTGKKEVEEFKQMTSNPQDVMANIDNVPTYKPFKSDEKYKYPYPEYEKHIQSHPSSYYQRPETKLNLDTFPMATNLSLTNHDNNNKLLMEKLNYMIHLLEETHDEQTNNVLEEVILYSFLGIFIIFLIDNFIKVGRYVR